MLVLSAAFSGCAAPANAHDAQHVSENVQARTGFSLKASREADIFVLPNGAAIADGLSDDEAGLIALWNNAAFRELLGDLGIASADLVQAGILPNPELAFFSEMSGKPFKYVFDMPLEAFWLRPYRLRIAKQDSARVAERITQAALDLIRDTRRAHLELVLAHARYEVRMQSLEMRRKMSGIAQTRLDAGDIGPQEASVSRIDALQAEIDVARAEMEIELGDLRLRHLMGMEKTSPEPLRVLPAAMMTQDWSDSDLLSAAQKRPDALAVEHSIAAAQERLSFAKIGWVRLLGIVDASSGDSGHVAGPAVRVTLPIFNWNEGGIARAEADLEKVVRQRETVRNAIALEVREALARYRRLSTELGTVQNKIRPEINTAIQRAQSAYSEGGASYLVVLETTRQLIDTRLYEEQLKGELRQAWVDLERSVGKRLDIASATMQPEAPSTTREATR